MSPSGVESLLVTGPPDARGVFFASTILVANFIDHRGETARYTCMSEDLGYVEQAARRAHVTLQRIVRTGAENARETALPCGGSVKVSDCVEEYPVLYLAPHGMKWERTK